MFKKLLKLLRLNTPHIVELNQYCGGYSEPIVEHKTFTETGEFIKAADFERIWIVKNVNDKYSAPQVLNDDEYLDYKLWEDMNLETMYKKHLPNARVFIGKNTNIIFHGGCLGCMSQRLHGFERCKGCRYFRCNWGKENLHINGEDSAKLSVDDFKRLLGRE